MVTVVALVGLAAIVGIHTVIAAVMTRFFRVRLDTRWGPVVFAIALVPVALTISTLVLSGVLGLGPDLGSPAAAMFVLVVVPMALGLTIDYIWMPPPEAVEFPERVPRSRNGD